MARKEPGGCLLGERSQWETVYDIKINNVINEQEPVSRLEIENS